MYSHATSQLFSNLKTNHFYSYLMYLNNRRKNEVLHYKRLKELQKIIENQALDTFFQPILKLSSGETIGYEALNRPTATNLFTNTESFYDFVGQTNQVFLFECFCRNISLKRFMERYKERNSLIFINIHPNVLLDSTYHSGETLQLLSGLGIEPKQVVFELTEKSAVTDFKLFEKVLSNYRAQGFRIAIDDVGSGYNSLKTLVYLKPEFIKLDKSLIQNIDQNKEQQQLVKLIIDYAKQSSTEIIAEGIERMEELAFICEQGVDYGQGFALGKPKEEVKPGRIPQYSIPHHEFSPAI
ncbi:EAL domain-containing protein (putative c-di-GMP-specific phosphodiesterase class I) [Neobacillus niacini]|uniref:EAL domain-containing protein n=1 Tax=Neobacillus niacini TaxID=86668 RepID=UPI002855DEBB|nr:EAL domain-containing protein [Neobacillus niacini]MDR7080592.1 EAL domain-containing protein (putative c-di-GMP-specific phosphodiesterase class I) [Neobacillus niacini]